MAAKELAKEYPHPKEALFAREITSMFFKKLDHTCGPGKYQKGLHTKDIALLEARLTVDADLPDQLKAGLFKACRVYKAWVRFTGASPNILADAEPGTRGIAIKLLDVGEAPVEKDDLGNTQDILLTNNPITFPGTVAQQAQAIKAVLSSPLHALPIFRRQTMQQIRHFLKWRGAQVQTPSLLALNYYSAVPYLFGEGRAIKWHLRALAPVSAAMPAGPHKNFLRHTLARELCPGEVQLGLFVQFQQNAFSEPIEDAAVEWKTPFEKVATLTLIPQHFDTGERKALNEFMCFSPWHALADHRPLGGINRLRRVVYRELSQHRCNHNKDIERNTCPVHQPQTSNQ